MISLVVVINKSLVIIPSEILVLTLCSKAPRIYTHGQGRSVVLKEVTVALFSRESYDKLAKGQNKHPIVNDPDRDILIP